MWLFLIVVTIEQGISIKNSVPLNSQFRVIDTRKCFIRITLYFVRIFYISFIWASLKYTIYDIPTFCKNRILSDKAENKSFDKKQ